MNFSVLFHNESTSDDVTDTTEESGSSEFKRTLVWEECDTRFSLKRITMTVVLCEDGWMDGWRGITYEIFALTPETFDLS